jgi:hypothetical protein
MRVGVVHLLLSGYLLLPSEAESAMPRLEASRLKTAGVKYDDSSRIERFPVPVVSLRRPGLANGEQEMTDIQERIIYPLVLESKKPICAVVVEFIPNDSSAIAVSVIWSDGETREALVCKTSEGRYDPASHKVFFARPVP